MVLIVFWKPFIIAVNISAVGDDVGNKLFVLVVSLHSSRHSTSDDVATEGVGECFSALVAKSDGNTSFGDVNLNFVFNKLTSSLPLSMASGSSS